MIAPDDTTFAYLEGRPGAPAGGQSGSRRSTAGARSRPIPTHVYDSEFAIDVSELAPQVTWGTNPEMVVPVTARCPDPADYADPGEREAAERALTYMGLEPGTAIGDIPRRPRLHRLVHERADRGSARGRGGRRRQARPPDACAPSSSPARPRVKRQAEDEGLDRIFKARRLRVAPRRLLDVPRHEPGRPRSPASAAPRRRTATSRAARGAAGARISSARSWPLRRRSPATSSTRARWRRRREAVPPRHRPARPCSTARTSTRIRSSRSSS